MRPIRSKMVRPTQVVPADLANSLLDCIGHMFYPDRAKTPGERKRWAMDKHWYRQRVITWAARWLDSKAVTLPPDRFKKLILDKLSDIKNHASGQSSTNPSIHSSIQNWPRYILKCFQDHFHHNGEAIYNEAKTFRHQLDVALDKARLTGHPSEQTIDPIRVLALAHQLNRQKPSKKPVAKPANQPNLFDL